MARRPPNRKRPTPAVDRRSASSRAVVTHEAEETAEAPRTLVARLGAEFLGTFFLVVAGCGSALFAAASLNGGLDVGIGYLGVALAFGLAVLVMAVAVGGISGGHFNPAVTIGLACAGRIKWQLVVPYVVTQIVAGIAGATLLFCIAAGRPGFNPTHNGFTSNGYGIRSPDGYSLGSAILAELFLTAIFVTVIIAVTGKKASKTLAPIAIGLTLTLIHLISIPIDNTSVNPARSLAVALFAGPGALGQVWLFLLVPTVGGALAGLGSRGLTSLHIGLGGEGSGDS